MAESMGFFTDTTICIGCKACEIACKEWNQLPGHAPKFGDGFDNTAGGLDEQNWRHVQFHERATPQGGVAWNMMSDVCKHCEHASCMEVCPTNAIVKTEFGTGAHLAGGLQRLPRLHRRVPCTTSLVSTRPAVWRRSARSATTACRTICRRRARKRARPSRSSSVILPRCGRSRATGSRPCTRTA